MPMGYPLYKNTQINCDIENLKIPVFLEIFHFSLVQFNICLISNYRKYYRSIKQIVKALLRANNNFCFRWVFRFGKCVYIQKGKTRD